MFRRRIRRKMSCTTLGAKPLVGSSSIYRPGRDMSVRPMAVICCLLLEVMPAPLRRRSLRHRKNA